MPLHQRQIIREAIRDALVAANTSAGSRVYETRVVPWHRVELPAIAVYTLNETVAPESKTTGPRVLQRLSHLEVVAAVEASANVDDALDAIALEIERAMHADETFGGACGRSILTSSELAVEVEGQKPLGFLSLIYEVTYYTDAPEAADVTLDDLSTVDTKYDLGNAQPAGDQAEDTQTNLEV